MSDVATSRALLDEGNRMFVAYLWCWTTLMSFVVPLWYMSSNIGFSKMLCLSLVLEDVEQAVISGWQIPARACEGGVVHVTIIFSAIFAVLSVIETSGSVSNWLGDVVGYPGDEQSYQRMP